ncbi:hypothetical protein AJ78_05887 [Emergomyces pasteurianus Ep9510]|uniref:Uncharacterized protein n=1 Tax=Emergomyces pasteurianus Ep9510 TaxID=1447872 RepID=A0A1J9PAW4_9EURO|nr:hypothetical protein AJ78_05887 [Emergomyces pasteurianus Ep9510]
MVAKNKSTPCSRNRGSNSSTAVEKSNSRQTENVTGSIISSLPSLMGPRTPTRNVRAARKVRFSEPGATIEQLSGDIDGSLSTGLTPAIRRTRMESQDSPSSKGPGARRTRRRRSEPAPLTDNDGIKYELPELPHETQTFQFLSCSAILDPRSRRRIARFGLSEEMNNIIERKRDREKKRRVKEEEFINLQRELRALRDVKPEAQDNSTPHTPERVRELSKARRRIEELEVLLGRYEESACGESPCMSQTVNEHEDMIFVCDDITMMDNEMLTTSLSPIPPRLTSSHLRTSDASTQVALEDPRQQAENSSLSAQLHNMRQEKRVLFREWRSIVGSNGAGTKDEALNEISLDSPASSPPPNLLPQVATALREAVSRESKTLKTLENVAKCLSGHGFNGSCASEILVDMGARFRQARIELERAVPGETANGNLTNWKEIIDMLAKRIITLAEDLTSTEAQVSECERREVVLRNEFNMTLHQLEQTSKKSKILEEASDSMAEDVIHIRMKMQRLEQEIGVLETDKVRLNNAIESYRTDLKILEELNMKLEEDAIASIQETARLHSANSALNEEMEQSNKTIANLEQNKASQQTILGETQRLLNQRTMDLTAVEKNIEQLKSEHAQAIASISHSHDKQMGAMNVRISLLTNALNESQAEVQTLRADRARLQCRLNSLQQLFSRETIHTATERASTTVKELMEWEQGMSALYGGSIQDPPSQQGGQTDSPYVTGSDSKGYGGATNNNIDGFAAIGSEPITPSCDRFVNVEIQRGKKRKRRRPDSAIEIVDEEEDEGQEGFEDSALVDRLYGG